MEPEDDEGDQLHPQTNPSEPNNHEGDSDTDDPELGSTAASDQGSGPGPAPQAVMKSQSQRNPRPLDFSSLLQQQCGVLQLSLSLCKRCGPIICDYLRTLFPHFLSGFHAAATAPPTELLHIWYHCQWHLQVDNRT